jgi:hypothetical protein
MVAQLTLTDKVLQHILVVTAFLELSQPTVVVVVEVGTALRQCPADQVAEELPVVKVLDLTITPAPTTVEIPVWVADQSLDKVFQEALALGLIVNQTIAIKPVVAVAQVALASVQKMTATKAAWAKVVQGLLMIF